LAEMEHVVPWARLMEVIEPYYPKSGRRGRPPIGLERMLRMLHGQEDSVGADAGYVGVEKREDMKAALTANGQTVQWRIARRRKAIKKIAEVWRKNLAQAYEKLKSRARARVEHPFHVIKNLFHYKKTRYQGIAKNDTQLTMLFGLSNLYMMRGELRP